MPPLKNQRHERFAFAVVAGMPDMRAYEEAGYTNGMNAQRNAYRLKEYDGVRRRIAELRAKQMGKYVLSGRQVLERLTEVADGGRDALTVKSLELLGKHHDLWNETARSSITINDFNRMSTAELMAIARGEGPLIEGEVQKATSATEDRTEAARPRHAGFVPAESEAGAATFGVSHALPKTESSGSDGE